MKILIYKQKVLYIFNNFLIYYSLIKQKEKKHYATYIIFCFIIIYLKITYYKIKLNLNIILFKILLKRNIY